MSRLQEVHGAGSRVRMTEVKRWRESPADALENSLQT
jgi:hypothetical protein